MNGAGNDIVALAVINATRTRQPNFYSKIILPTEQELYTAEFEDKLPFEHFIWLAWSVKESIYKFLQKKTPGLVFSPSKIIIKRLLAPQSLIEVTKLSEGRGFECIPAYEGEVAFGNETLYSRSLIDKDFIFSAVNFNDDFTHTCWGIKQIASSDPAYQSHEARALLVSRLNDILGSTNIHIGKSPFGWPVAIKDETELPLPVSLAHHDQYIAYSFQLK